jgi:adenine-specific DNA-methyltransferase
MSPEPDKIDLETPDLAAAKRAAFEELFPGVLADGVLDATRLGELLDTEVTAPADGRERFGLMWAGKHDAVRALLTPSRGTLVPEPERSIDFESADHVFIEGDNLEVLKLLQKAYNDRVKLIYIDPPYNTGNNDFIYSDNFADTTRGYLQYTGQLDDDGNRLSASADTAGRKHSRWLSMMYPRLVLARNLLQQDGAIFVSIDDNEVANLRVVMDEVFGPENFVAQLVWQKVYSPMNSRQQFAVVHDYILVYARNGVAWRPNLLPRTAEQDAAYKNPDDDPRGPWMSDNFTAPAGHATPAQHYELVTPAGKRFMPPAGRAWVFTQMRYEELRADNRVWFGKDGMGVPRVKRFLAEVKQGRVPESFWPYSEVGHNQDAKKQLLQRVKFGSSDSVFDTPKPTQLIRRMVTLATSPNDGDIVLDFFAGSGSAADAVLQHNAEDGGNRRFIGVQLPEPTGHDDFALVSDITRARIAAAIEDVGGQGVRSYRLANSNFRGDVGVEPTDLFDLSESTLRNPDQAAEAIAAEVLLKEGIPLDVPWTESVADSAKVIEAGGVAVVLSSEITGDVVADALALGARVVVFLEDGFTGVDAVKANAVTNARNSGITLKTV